MGFLENGEKQELLSGAGGPLYRALAIGDLAAAWLLARPLIENMKTERTKTEKLPAATAFNCGLCLYRLGEYEKALAQLKQAEQLLGAPPDLAPLEKKLFFQAVENRKQMFLQPLDPEGGKGLERYFLIRIRWLAAHCLTHLERSREAASEIRFLAQYHVEL